MSRYLLIALVVLSACEKPSVHVRASIPALDGGDVPVANLELIALPYDRDSVLAALEAAASPRPHTRELDSLFALWRTPFVQFARASYRVGKFRDSLATLRRQLDSLPRNAPAYQALYQRFGALTDSLSAAREQGEPSRRELDKLRGVLLPRIDSLRRAVTAWENSTFQNYERIVNDRSGTREARAATTGPDGRAALSLDEGRWWIYAWVWDEGDPYSRWYWNVPVTGDTVVLDQRSGRKKPQY